MSSSGTSFSKYIFTFLLFVVGCVALYAIWWVYKLPKPTPGTGCNSNMKWDPNCEYIQEIHPDPTLASPKALQLKLVNFQSAQGVGPSLFVGCWYRFRYVNTATGGYSDFSKWTASPIYAGACELPCDGTCNFPTGLGSCSYNQPSVGIDTTQSHYSPKETTPQKSFIYINIHRYVNFANPFSTTPPDDNVEDEIIGVGIMPLSSKGKSYWGIIDATDNPCKNGCTMPSTCSGGGKC